MFLYESVIRVPLILWRPGVLPVGKVVATPVRTLDLSPAILDILGAPPLTAPHARSLQGILDGRSPPPPFAAYAETYVPKFAMGGAALRALRYGRFKLIDAPRPELYDLARDPGETRNRFADEPRTAHALRGELDRLTAGGNGAMNVRPVDNKAVEKLEGPRLPGGGSGPVLGRRGRGGEGSQGPDRDLQSALARRGSGTDASIHGSAPDPPRRDRRATPERLRAHASRQHALGNAPVLPGDRRAPGLPRPRSPTRTSAIGRTPCERRVRRSPSTPTSATPASSGRVSSRRSARKRSRSSAPRSPPTRTGRRSG